jgi:hypothetical protein
LTATATWLSSITCQLGQHLDLALEQVAASTIPILVEDAQDLARVDGRGAFKRRSASDRLRASCAGGAHATGGLADAQGTAAPRA